MKKFYGSFQRAYPIRTAKPARNGYDLNFFRGGIMDELEYTAKIISFPNSALNSFSADFLNEADCNSWFISLAHPADPSCPKCKTKITDNITLKNFLSLKRCTCKNCKLWFTAKTGTILQDSKISVREFYLLSLLLSLKIPTSEISRILKTTQGTVNLWQKKIDLFKEAA
ncbi:MAG: hypothetical protein FD156_188 [Nitrospirae bacterium]|nr:MAG: hypothetical protein FD156_188 [Nitrospirota bacterium]